MKFLLIFILVCCSRLLVLAQTPQLDSLFQLLKTTKSDTSKAVVYFKIANRFQKIDRLKSFDYGQKALNIARAHNSQLQVGEYLNFLGDLYWYSGDYATCSDYYFEALSIYDALDDDNGRAVCFRNIGWIYQGQKNYELTLTYFYKSLSLNKKLGKERRVLSNYDDLSIAYFLKEDYPKAELYCNKTIAYAKEHNYRSGLATGHANLAGVLLALGKIDEAIENYQLAIDQFKEINDFYNMADGFNGIAKCYLEKEKYDLCIQSSKEALIIALKYDYNLLVADAYHNLSVAFAKVKQYDKAYTNLMLYTNVKDSTFNEKNAELIGEMSAKYEFEKSELLIKSLKDDKKLNEVKLEQEQTFKLYLIVFCVVVVAFLLFLYRIMLQRKKVTASLSDAYKQIEIKNKDITDSITYSKKIQEAMLPLDHLKDELFNDVFIYFQPKDIVSGDFYWYAEKNGSRIIAACDCTGHGVPGALMSMIGTNMLNQIINEKGIISPNEVLDTLNREIKKALRQDDQSTHSKDGMDVAILRFVDENTVEYAGAHRPLWIIRNNELIEYKPSKYTIGGMQNEGEKIFVNHRIELQKDDCLYIFTDGVVDQFGGPEGKKFMSKQLRKVLLSIHNHPMTVQRQLLRDAIELWQGDEAQIDDNLVIGIKV